MGFLTSTRNVSVVRQCAISLGLVLGVSLLCFYSQELIGYRVVALILLMTVSVLAMLFEILPVLMAAVLSAMIWNFFFIPPLYTFHIDNTEDVLMFLLYFLIALVNAALTIKIREAETKARDREEKANTIKLYDTLLNSLSHELRTPIAAILGAVDTLQAGREKLTHDQEVQLLAGIDTASLRLNRQVENLLSMSRLQSGMLKLHIDWCDLNELIHSVIEKLGPHRQSINFTPGDNLPLVKLDAGLMEQVIYNLLHNAVQYTPDTATITIKAENPEERCVITVTDDGPGFPADQLPFVFDKFYRLPQTRPGGSGLGLSIVKGFVEAHGGTVALQSQLGKGATFTIDIPVETSYLSNLKNE